jgi:hypothetical protein
MKTAEQEQRTAHIFTVALATLSVIAGIFYLFDLSKIGLVFVALLVVAMFIWLAWMLATLGSRYYHRQLERKIARDFMFKQVDNA